MARKANYEEKISALEAKIEKKQSELKKLKEQLASVNEQKAKADNAELLNYMAENGLSAAEVLGAIKE